MRWDIEHTRRVIGYVPLDSATPVITDETRRMDEVARARRLVPGQWYNESFELVDP